MGWTTRGWSTSEFKVEHVDQVGVSNIFYLHPIPGEDSHFDVHIFWNGLKPPTSWASIYHDSWHSNLRTSKLCQLLDCCGWSIKHVNNIHTHQVLFKEGAIWKGGNHSPRRCWEKHTSSHVLITRFGAWKDDFNISSRRYREQYSTGWMYATNRILFLSWRSDIIFSTFFMSDIFFSGFLCAMTLGHQLHIPRLSDFTNLYTQQRRKMERKAVTGVLLFDHLCWIFISLRIHGTDIFSYMTRIDFYGKCR